MIFTTGMLNQKLKNYANPAAAVRRKVSKGELIRIRQGLYETDSRIPGHCLALMIYGPSYLSFDYALSYYDLIPEGVVCFTSATMNKHKTKEFQTPFGIYTYRDIPSSAYPWGLVYETEQGYPFMIASPEKAVCDKLYTISPLKNQKELRMCLFEDLRIDEQQFKKLDKEKLLNLSGSYKTINHRLLQSFLGSSKL